MEFNRREEKKGGDLVLYIPRLEIYDGLLKTLQRPGEAYLRLAPGWTFCDLASEKKGLLVKVGLVTVTLAIAIISSPNRTLD